MLVDITIQDIAQVIAILQAYSNDYLKMRLVLFFLTFNVRQFKSQVTANTTYLSNSGGTSSRMYGENIQFRKASTSTQKNQHLTLKMESVFQKLLKRRTTCKNAGIMAFF